MTTTQQSNGFETIFPEHDDDPNEPGWALGSAGVRATDQPNEEGAADLAHETHLAHFAHRVHLEHLAHVTHLVDLEHSTLPASPVPFAHPAPNGHATTARFGVVEATRPAQLTRAAQAAGTTQDARAAAAGQPAPTPQPQPGAAATAAGTSARPQPQHIGPTAAVVIATVVVLAGLGAWAAFSTFAGQGQLWQQSRIPVGAQPYDVKPIAQVVVPPSIANTAKAVAQAKLAAKENPMVVTTPSAHVVLKVNPPPLGGRYAANGQVEDDFSPSYFAVPAGKTIHVTVLSYDTGYHTFTAPELGVNVWIHPAKGSIPGKTSFTFKAPSTGNFWWLCDVPCDPYSMSRGGLMQGEIHAVKS